jgi:hypothetical protein
MNLTYLLHSVRVHPLPTTYRSEAWAGRVHRHVAAGRTKKVKAMRAVKLLTLVAMSVLAFAAHAQTAAPSPAAAGASQSAGHSTEGHGAEGRGAEDPATKARWEKYRAACGADLQTHCATVARGTEQGRTEMRQCVEANKAKFSAGCQAAITERAAERAARKDAPAVDTKPKG